jgi:glycosyltransferase involved in cell wall biosynthesis
VRILQLAPVWETVPPPGYGGTEAVVHVLTEELVRLGHDVTLAASGDSRTSAKLISTIPTSLRRAGLMQDALQYGLVHVAHALKDAGDYDVIHNHNGPPNEIAMAMSRLITTPILTTLHNYPTEQTREIWKHYEGWYNAISAQQLRTIQELPKARCAGVAYNAIDVESFPFQPIKQDFALFIGRFTYDKGTHLAIDAAERAGRRIILAGKASVPDEIDYFESYVRPRLRPGRVEFVGEADAKLKRELFANAGVLLMPLLWDEPFGLVMIEAMACGTPVIVFDRGAASELVMDGETGFLVHTTEEMVAKMDCLDGINPMLCRSHVEKRFSPAALAARYLEIYEQIADGITEAPYDRILA